MKLTSTASGVIVIAPTPFMPDGAIDAASIDRMTDFFVASGVTGITVLGQLGEAPKLEHAESVDVVKRDQARRQFTHHRRCFGAGFRGYARPHT